MIATLTLVPTTITCRHVAEHLCVEGYVTATLPRTDAELSVLIARAYEGTPIRLGDLPERPADFREIRQHVEMMTREFERRGRSVECARYAPPSMGRVQ